MTQEIDAKVDVTELSSTRRELRFEIPWPTVQEHLEERYVEIRRTARPIKGFRKGKAPKWLLEQLFGSQVYAEVSQELITQALTKVLIERKLAPIAPPELEPRSVKPGEALSFIARIEVRPKLENVCWEGLELKRELQQVIDKDVDDEVERLRGDAASVVTPEPARPARFGDVLVIDYEVRTEGKDEPERTRQDMEIEVGKGMLLEKVEQALLGVAVGEEKVVDVELPGRAGDEGTKLLFSIKVKEIREKILPVVDDAFAKDVSEHETLLELRLALRQDLEKRASSIADGQLKDKMLDALCDANPVEVPPSLVEQQLAETQAEVARMLQLDLVRQPFSEEQTQRMRESGERKVRAGLLLSHISEEEGLEVSEGEVEARLAEIAEQTGQPLPRIKAQFGRQEGLDQLRMSILEQKVVDRILSKAHIIDVPREREQAQEGSSGSTSPAEDATEPK